MCGIAGLYNLAHGPELLPRMLQAMAHRGPDAQGTYQLHTAGVQASLGHRRLSIIDLSEAANQPFEKDGLVIAFNGEIYNFQELAGQLRASGVCFRTSSDTEVLLEAWRKWGPGCLTRLRGMFAFAILDAASGRMVLARDPFGIKPLFIARRGDGLVFASELKALRVALEGSLALDHAALVSSLMYYWVPESHCVYSGVEKLAPGHWASISPEGDYSSTCYYDPQQELVRDTSGEVDIERLRDTIEESVSAHMVADVPVAAFLSGGLDSSAISVIAARQGHSIQAFTIKFREEDSRLEAMPDDLRYARRVAASIGIRLNEIEIAPDLVNMLPRMVHMLDEPIGDAAALNTYLICSAARTAGAKVLLSGMGADELFGGYRKHYACVLAARYRRLPLALREHVIAPVVRKLPVAREDRGYRTIRWAKRFLTFANMPEEAAFRRSYTHYGVAEFSQLLNPDLVRHVDRLVAEHEALYCEYDGGSSGDPVNSMCYTDVRHFLPGLNLAYTDRASMAASTEVRVPYVDREVVRAAFSIAGRHKIAGRQSKAVLKKAAEAWLPNDVVYRPKAVFSAPLRAWLRRDMRELVDDLLVGGSLVKSGFLNGACVSRMVDEDRSGIADRSKEIWQLMTLESWLREQPVGL